MHIRGNRRRRSVDRGFVLSDHCDWNGLNQSIRGTGAESVWVTHGYANELVRWLQRLGIDIDVTQTLGSYPVAVQQMAAFARALEISSARILILDEPTSSLDANETARLFEVMRRMKGDGVAIVFITHFLDQVYEISDRITVLRNGELVGTFETAALPHVELIQHMIGRTMADLDEMAGMKQESAKHIRGEATGSRGAGPRRSSPAGRSGDARRRGARLCRTAGIGPDGAGSPVVWD